MDLVLSNGKQLDGKVTSRIYFCRLSSKVCNQRSSFYAKGEAQPVLGPCMGTQKTYSSPPPPDAILKDWG